MTGAAKVITRETTDIGGCSIKTVHKKDAAGSTTMRKTNCDNPARTADSEKAASHDAAFSYAQRPSD